MTVNVPIVTFVDKPDLASLATRFNFNDGTAWPAADAFDLGVPSLDGDPDGVGAEYGFRTLSFNLIVQGDQATALAKQAALARELVRRENWLMFKLSANSTPVFFKTYRTEPGDLSLDYVYNDDGVGHWQIGVQLTADPFAYGERVTLLDAATITNDPAAGTNPMSYTLPAILGDAPASLRASVQPTALMQARVMLNVAPTPASFAGPYVWQSSALGAVTDTSAETANSAYSGGGYRSVSFSTNANLTTRLTGQLPTAPPPGRYKILARITRSDTSSAFEMRGTVDGIVGQKVTVSGTSDAGNWGTLVDLGDFAMPRGGDGAGRSTWGVASNPVTLTFEAGRTSGTGTLGIDYFLAVPLIFGEGGREARTLFADVTGVQFGSPWLRLALDGDVEDVTYLYGNVPAGGTGPTVNGQIPVVHPGETNTLHLALHVENKPKRADVGTGAQSNTDSITTTSRVYLYYHPRYLYLAAS